MGGTGLWSFVSELYNKSGTNGSKLAHRAKQPIDSPVISHVQTAITTGFNCHLAVVYWGLLTIDYDAAQASKIIQSFMRRYCKRCKEVNTGTQKNQYGPASHSTTPIVKQYATRFIRGAIKTNSVQVADHAEVGDVIIIGEAAMPLHSMVVVGKNWRGSVLVRGFNNTQTFGLDAKTRDTYDNNDRDLFWMTIDAKTKTFHVVKNAVFIQSVNLFASEFSMQ